MPDLISLYPEVERAAVETDVARGLNSECSKCPHYANASPGSVCIGADGDPGGVLVIGEAPSREDDSSARPFVGQSGRYLRKLLTKHWDGPVAFDMALRCFPGKKEIKTKHIDACRGYLTQTVMEVRPKRIVALGATASYALLGRSISPISVRRGFGWLTGWKEDGWQPVPVFLVVHPTAALRNRFVREWFEADLVWALQAQPMIPKLWQGTARIVTTPLDALEAEEEMRDADWFSFDVETCGRMFDPGFRVLCLSVAPKGCDSPWVWDEAGLKDPERLAPLRRVLEDPNVAKGGSYVKFDINAVRQGLGVRVRGITFDTSLKRKLQDTEADGHLAAMADLVGLGGHKNEADDIMGAAITKFRADAKSGVAFLSELGVHTKRACEADGRKIKTYSYALIPPTILQRYCARDAGATSAIEELLERRMKGEPNLSRVWSQLVKPAIPALAQMEWWGMAVSISQMLNFSRHLDARLERIRGRFSQYPNFNPVSAKQVGDLLFGKLGLQPAFETDGGKPSTDKNALAELRGKHPIVDDIIEWRHLIHTKSTYADGMSEHVQSDGRIHPDVKLDGARTGRVSCSNPNLQNIPRDADSVEGKMSRDCFVAPPGRVLLAADFSQIELRIAAALSGDPFMRQIFLDGEDFHQRTAQFIAPIVWGIPAEAVEKKHRSAAKAFNFGVIYGMGDEGIADRASCTRAEATKIREAILGRFKRLAKYIEEKLLESRKSGVSWTWWNGDFARRRSLYRIADNDEFARSKAEHSAWNAPIQGTASDYCLASIIEVVRWILEDGIDAKLVIAVHDSIILEVRQGDVPEVAAQVRRIMTSWPVLESVPLAVDIEVGPAWGSLVKYEE